MRLILVDYSMGRKPCCDKQEVKRGLWTAEEDEKLVSFILTNGPCCWRAVPKLAGLRRCGKSCRLRWTNYLRPDLKRGLLTAAEEHIVIDLHAKLGNRWSKIAAQLPGRTDNEIKNHWNTHIKKKLIKMGIDPATHQLLDDTCKAAATTPAAASQSTFDTVDMMQSLKERSQQETVPIPTADDSSDQQSGSWPEQINHDLLDPMMKNWQSLDVDRPSDDEPWLNFTSSCIGDELGIVTVADPLPSDGALLDWLLDYQDLGIYDSSDLFGNSTVHGSNGSNL